MGTLISRSAAALGLSVLVCAAPSFSADKELTAVADLRYGSALYHYHLDEYMEALSELLVAQKQGGIAGHGDNPALMEAGLALGYKMERRASEIFKQILEDNRSSSVRDAAWFYLAKIRYGHGEWLRASEALSHISEKPDAALLSEIIPLKINLYIKQNKLTSALILYDQEDLSPHWRAYLTFNIGSAYARKKQYKEAVRYFDYLAQDLFDDEEYKVLHDKAMAAAGFSYLFLEDYEISKAKFSRVRSNSVLANRAMLGYSWAAIELGDFDDAKRVLRHLGNSPLNDENKQEALLALPYAYEQMGDLAPALKAYQGAAEEYKKEINDIDSIYSQLDNSELLSVLDVPVSEELDWLDLANQKSLSPKLSYLVSLFSQNNFQLAVEQLQDLLYLNSVMDTWLEKIAFYEGMLAYRENRRLQNADQASVQKQEIKNQNLSEVYLNLNSQLDDLDSKQDYLALTNDEERALLQRIEKSEQRIHRLEETDPFVDEYKESLRRYRGLLLWQASEHYSDRYWSIKKSLLKTESTVSNINEVESRLDALQNDTVDIQPWYTQLELSRNEILSLQVRLQSLIQSSESELISRLKNELADKREGLTNYLALSRLSIARLQDTAREQSLLNEIEQSKLQSEQNSTNKKASRTNPELLKVPSLSFPNKADQDTGQPAAVPLKEAAQ